MLYNICCVFHDLKNITSLKILISQTASILKSILDHYGNFKKVNKQVNGASHKSTILTYIILTREVFCFD